MKTRRMTIRFPTGGVNKRTSFQTQPPYTAFAASNAWPDNVADGRERGGVRPGLATAITGTLPGPIRMLHEINVSTETGTESVLVCSANGGFYRYNATDGDWDNIPSSFSLATDRTVQAAVFGQKLYIADWGILDSGDDMETAGSNTVLSLAAKESGTDGAIDGTGLIFTSAGSTFVTEGVTAGVDVLRVTDQGDGTGATLGVYEIASVDSETQLTLSTSPGTSEVGIDFEVRPSFAHIGVSSDNHGLEILEAGNGTAGFYTISSVDDDRITVSSSVGGSPVTAIEYRIHRVPKVWDLTDNTISAWTASAGTLPLSCNVICYYHDRIILAGAPSYPQVWYASAMGDPTDFDYAGDDVESAVAGNNYSGGQIGDPITALIPHNRQCLVIGAEDSLYVLRGDPNSPSSTLDQLSDVLGPISPQAWCKDSQYRTWMLTRDGLYVMPPGCGETPTSFSREKIPNDLLNIPASDFNVHMAYDDLQRAVHVYAMGSKIHVSGTNGAGSGFSFTSASFSDWASVGVEAGDYLRWFDGGVASDILINSVSGGTLTLDNDDLDGVTGVTFEVRKQGIRDDMLYWVDTDRGGIWPMSVGRAYRPTAIATYRRLSDEDRAPVILGTVGGTTLQYSRAAATDPGVTTIDSTITIGPFPISRSTFERSLIRHARMVPIDGTASITWTLRTAATAEEAATGTSHNFASSDALRSTTYTTALGYLQTQAPRLVGHAAVVVVGNNSAFNWGMEQLDLEVAEQAGRLR